MAKRRKISINAKPITNISQIKQTSIKSPFRLRIKKALSSTWGIVCGVVVVMGVLAFFYEMPFRKNFETPHDKYVEQNFAKGILIPSSISDQYPLVFYCGSNTFSYSKRVLIQGVKYDPNPISVDDAAPNNINFKLIGDRLFIYSTLKDLDTEDVIGTIDSNFYMLKTSRIFNYKSDDHGLEIYDNKNNVVFSLEFKYPNTVNFKGYVIGKTACLVISDRSWKIIYKSDKNYQVQARSEIEKIPHIFP